MSDPNNPPSYADLPAGARALAQIGSQCSAAVTKFWSQRQNVPLLPPPDDEILRRIAAAMAGTWKDEPASKVLAAYFEQIQTRGDLDGTSVVKWLWTQPNDSDAVRYCLETKPPREVNLERVLSRRGSQKIVFLATWEALKLQVVAKKIVGDKARVEALSRRETLQTHPLVSDHPNIIKTSLLRNEDNEPFLVEEKIEPLTDGTVYQLEDAANLFRDIAAALEFLHNERGWVHGDIKPDNIGRKGARFLLLDFGIARDRTEFTKDVTATGSIRTRAPELLNADNYSAEPTKADIWALGATIFNVVARRFPLFDYDEGAPRIDDQEGRNRFEIELKNRAEREWDSRVTSALSTFSPALRKPLSAALQADPLRRCSVNELTALLRESLGSYLRDDTTLHHLSPSEELAQIVKTVTAKSIARAPESFKSALRVRLNKLKTEGGIDTAEVERLLGLLTPSVLSSRF